MEIPKRTLPRAVPGATPARTVVVVEQPSNGPEFRDCGIWEPGETYTRGAGVTCRGSYWLAVGDPAVGARPGQNGAWRLIAKRGRDGLEGDPGPPPRHEWEGTKLRFEQADGSWGKWVDLKGEPGRDGVGGGVLIKHETVAPSFSYFPGGW